MPIIRIDQIDDSRLDDYKNVPDAELIRRRGLFVAEGRLVVRRLLESQHAVVSLLLNEAALRNLSDSLNSIVDAIPVYICATSEFASIVGFDLHRGCLALARRPAELDAANVVRNSKLMLMLDGVTDPDNVGSAFRNAAAFGVDGVLLHGCCDPLYRKAVRTSMGSVLQIRHARSTNSPEAFEMMKAAGFAIAALTPNVQAVAIADFIRRSPRPHKMALLVGSEAHGLSPEALAAADACVRIPMRPDVDSLNLATATGIALYCLTS